MDKKKLIYFKNKLVEEKKRVNGVIEQLKKNEMTKFNAENASELSFYDNHPSDIATETFQVELGRALEANEKAMIDKIEDSLRSIDEGNYGKCAKCGKDIEEGRLEALPYAENCIECQQIISNIKTYNSTEKTSEEMVLGKPFGHRDYGVNKDETGFDEEDSYQAVDSFNKIDDLEDYYYEDEEYVEPIEKISNQQYKNQLPD